jgi:hypothetical protein
LFSLNTTLSEDVFGRERVTWPTLDRFNGSGLNAWARKAVAIRL